MTELNSSELTIFPYDFTAADYDGNLNIHIWGLSKGTESTLLRITNFPAYAYLQLPDDPRWLIKENQQIVLNYIYQNIPALVNSSFQQLFKLYYYTERRSNFILLAFRNLAGLSLLRKLINGNVLKLPEGSIPVELFEDDISVIWKLRAYKQLNYSQWFKVNGTLVPEAERVSKLNLEYLIDYETIAPIPETETINWLLTPKIMDFRISILKDQIVNLSLVCSEYNSTDSSSAFRTLFEYSTQTNQNTIVQVPDEKALIDKLFTQIQTYDPDIILGFEILSKLYPYLDKKVKKIYPNLSRLKNGNTHMSTRRWQSSSYGYNEVNLLQMEGRISLDLYFYIKRTFKLDQYTYDSVMNHFQIQTNKELFIPTNQAQQIFDLFYKTEAWDEITQLSNIVGVSIMDLFTRGEQLRIFSIIYSQAVWSRYVIDYQTQPEIDLEGAFQFHVEEGIFENTIWYDFKRLYPSIIIAYNICYTTLINQFQVPNSQVNLIVGTNHKLVFQNKFVKAEVRKGILPIILTQKIEQRNQVSHQIKNSEGMTRSRLIKREKIIKATTNAFYGFLAIQEEKGTLSLLEAARSILYLARDYIENVKEKLETDYQAVVLYSDTDSVGYQLPEVKKEDLHIEARRILHEINVELKEPIQLAFDYVARFVLVKAKKYALLIQDEKGNPTDQIVRKGLLIGRSDAPDFAEKVYSDILDSVLLEKSYQESFDVLLNHAIQLVNGQVPIDQLSMVKKINTTYSATSTYFLKTFLDRLAKIGIQIKKGTEVEYVILNNGGSKIGEKMQLFSLYQEGDRIDYSYYLESSLSQVDDLFQLGYKNLLSKNTTVGYKLPKSRKRPIGLNQPTQIIALQYGGGLRLEDLRDWLKNSLKI